MSDLQQEVYNEEYGVAMMEYVPEEKTYTFSEYFRRNIMELLQDHRLAKRKEYGSDKEFVASLSHTVRIIVRRVEGGRTLKSGVKKTTASGAFFPYLLVENEAFKPLERYGLYQVVSAKNYKDNCLIKALEHSGADEKVLTSIRCACRNRSIPARCLRNLCESNGIQIHIKKRTGSAKDGKMLKYGTFGPIYNIALVAGHYFINEPTGFTAYSIKNYHKLHDVPNFQTIYKMRSDGRCRRDEKRCISSFKLVSLLVDNKQHCLKTIPFTQEIYKSQFYDKATEMTDLYYTDEQLKRVEDTYFVSDEKKVERLRGELKERMEQLEKLKKQQANCDKSVCDKSAKLVRYIRTKIDRKWRKATPKVVKAIKSEIREWRYIDVEIIRSSEVPSDDKKGLLHHLNLDTNRFYQCETNYNCISTLVSTINKLNKKIEKLEKRMTNKVHKVRWFVDFEATTDGEKHRAFYCSLRSFDGVNNPFYGWDCAEQMFRWLKENTVEGNHNVLIAHNMAYDIRHMVSCVKMQEYLVNGSAFVKASGTYCKMQVSFKCSYRIIVSPLSKFSKLFPDIEQEKEVCPYGLFTQECVNKKWLSVSDALNDLGEKDHQKFLKNIDEWEIRRGDTFDIVKYAARYCDIDTEVLRQGWGIFRGWIKEHLDQDINEVVTVPSLAMRYLTENRCFDGCNKLSGVPRHFIQRCVVGGKTMTRHNKKMIVDDPDRPIADFDGVSLYPSAMRRISDELGGFLKGMPNVIEPEHLNVEWLSQQDGYFVECIVESVSVDRALPLLSYIDEQGIRRWSNQEMIGKTVYLDKISLEDAMEFQGARFRIVRGYYFDEGRNRNIGDVIQRVFDQRLAFKKQGNPVQAVFKLIMNAGYGGTCIRPSETKTLIVDTEEKDNQLQLNYNHIKSSTQINDDQHYIEKISPIDDHFNLVHIGVEILSMSKRIMNEVMCTAEDAGRKVFITDTDSLHIHEDELDGLAADFSEKYGRDLVGKQLGQFHTDFELKGCHSVIAKRAIFLGKKCYLDHLTGIDNESGESREGWHIRMKGVPTASIWHAANRDFDGDIWALYSHLLDGNTVEFDLLCGGKKCSFKSGKDMTVRSRVSFPRCVSFP
jgi:hypothetical protein